ncbi:receptor like protein 21-like, partial [Fagus crenata]
MEWPLVKSLLWALLLFAQIHEHRGCIEEERMGLIELKAFLKSNIHYTNHLLLPSWVNETKSECCGWEGVTCNTTTGHVIELSLYNLKQETDWYYLDNSETWFLNACLFQPFKELRSLNLSVNQIGGWRGNE